MTITPANLYDAIPATLNEELFTTLLDSEQVRINRIVSTGQASPTEGWYDQTDNEWVIVLKGEARIELEEEGIIELQPGSYLNIPAHKRHRVLWTSPVTQTVWLAVHYD